MLLLPDNTSGMQSWLDNVAFFNLFVWRIFNRINYETFSNDLCISNTILILANILAKSIHTCAKATGGKDDTIRIARDVQAANDQRPLRSRWLASDYVLYYGSHYAQSGSFLHPLLLSTMVIIHPSSSRSRMRGLTSRMNIINSLDAVSGRLQLTSDYHGFTDLQFTEKSPPLHWGSRSSIRRFMLFLFTV